MTDRDGNKHTRTGRPTSMVTYIAVAAITAAVGFGAVYAMRPAADKSTTASTTSTAPAVPAAGPAAQVRAPTSAATETASGRQGLAVGDMLTFVFRKTPEPIADFTFEDGRGAKKTLADWKGKVVLLNLWATWCAPCRHEMPSLDRLQKQLGGKDFEVIALSVDRQGAGPSQKFLDDIKVEKLALYIESTSKSLGTLKATGLPTTILIDRDGREIGRLAGPAEWDGADAVRLIESVLK